jgi:hypothetical protein
MISDIAAIRFSHENHQAVDRVRIHECMVSTTLWSCFPRHWHSLISGGGGGAGGNIINVRQLDNKKGTLVPCSTTVSMSS